MAATTIFWRRSAPLAIARGVAGRTIALLIQNHPLCLLALWFRSISTQYQSRMHIMCKCIYTLTYATRFTLRWIHIDRSSLYKILFLWILIFSSPYHWLSSPYVLRLISSKVFFLYFFFLRNLNKYFWCFYDQCSKSCGIFFLVDLRIFLKILLSFAFK